MTASYLVCKHGGIIFPLNSGQITYSAYTAPFLSYPHASDDGKEKNAEEEQQAFENWCEKYDICPYYPGTDGYMDWYQQKIDRMKESGASKKKIRAAYEECLDNAYFFGLDRMETENRRQVRDMVEQYADSGCLKEKDIEAMQQKYAGLRLDFGYNQQKNPANATPEEDAFYRYYEEKAGEYAGKQEELQEQLQKALYAEDTGMMSYISQQMESLEKEEREIYERFAGEIERYNGYLDEERQKQVQEVSSLFLQGGGECE